MTTPDGRVMAGGACKFHDDDGDDAGYDDGDGSDADGYDGDDGYDDDDDNASHCKIRPSAFTLRFTNLDFAYFVKLICI